MYVIPNPLQLIIIIITSCNPFHLPIYTHHCFIFLVRSLFDVRLVALDSSPCWCSGLRLRVGLSLSCWILVFTFVTAALSSALHMIILAPALVSTSACTVIVSNKLCWLAIASCLYSRSDTGCFKLDHHFCSFLFIAVDCFFICERCFFMLFFS